MPASTARLADSVLQMKITLRHAKPPIWRRILVPPEFSLGQLHAAIQLAMGWENCHLHEFMIDGESIGGNDPLGFDDEGPSGAGEDSVRVGEVLGRERAKARYMYDFGDDWDHDIVVEKILPRDPEAMYPLCVAGKGACPPEDCGGVYGYMNLVAILADPKHAEYADMLEWVGGPIDPEAFSIEEANARLALLIPKKRKPRKKK